MKLSDLYDTNSTIDFNDIVICSDNELFIDPFKIKKSKEDLSKKCNKKLLDFFSTATMYVMEEKSLDELFDKLNECNETRLGWSKDSPKGKGVSGKLGEQLSFAMKNHPLILNGVMEEIEDISIFIEGFGSDRISDICTRVILMELAEYTKEWCEKLNIPCALSLKEKHYWDSSTHTWGKARFILPSANNLDIIFTPVYFTSNCLALRDFSDFVNLGVLEYYKEFYKDEGLSSLERSLKNNQKKEPYKKDIVKFFKEKGIDIYDKAFFSDLDEKTQRKIVKIYKEYKNYKLQN
ncbi:MAG: hypothetical protein RSA18_03935 [Bacilli bacterium]